MSGGAYLYTVYDNRTTLPVIVDGTVKECAAAMGLSPKSFPAIVCRVRKGINKRWTIFSERHRETLNTDKLFRLMCELSVVSFFGGRVTTGEIWRKCDLSTYYFRKSLNELKNRGLVASRQGAGYWITPKGKRTEEYREAERRRRTQSA